MAVALMRCTEPCRSTAIPAKYTAHPLLMKRAFYTLPIELLNAMVRTVGRSRFDRELLQMEYGLSGIVGDHSDAAGFYDHCLISYKRLGEPPPIRLADLAAGPWNKTTAQLRNWERILTEGLDRFALPLRGYVGWLLTNPQFIREHDDLIMRHRRQILEFGIPQPIAVGGAIPDSVFGRARQDGTGWVNDFREFCGRWRLQSMAGPNLPCPLTPQVPCLLPGLTGIAASPGTETVLIPDIFPVSGTGALTEALHDAVHGNDRPEHLAGWFRIVAKENAAKNAIGHLARLFRLQHYWRAVHQRHAAAVNRRRGRLITAFAGYLQVSDDSVRKDLHWIAKRLGRDWQRRADPLVPQRR